MLFHAREELLALAEGCVLVEHESRQGWDVTVWRMDAGDVARAVAAYRALLDGGVGATAAALLLEDGIDLEELMVGGPTNEQITRADVMELVAAASMIAGDDCHVDRMHMPNVPKMARGKSDSGIDVIDVRMDPAGSPDNLGEQERLVVGSVKHTTSESSSKMRYGLATSLGRDELSMSYMARQLRVIHHHLITQGVPRSAADRIMLFLRDFYKTLSVRLVAVGCVDETVEADLDGQLDNLPQLDLRANRFRIITVPDIATLHEKCP